MNYDEKERLSLLASVANLYYNNEMNQNQIAQRLFTSRSKVSRLLQEAKERGVVEIIIHEPWDRDFTLEKEFRERYGLKDARILNCKEMESEDVLQKLAEAAAYYIDGRIDKTTVLGMSWGNTIYKTVQAVKSNKDIPLMVVPIMGAGISSSPQKESLDLSKELANVYGGKYAYIYAPLFVSSQSLRNELIKDPKIQEALFMARSANIILTSVGSIKYRSWKDYMSQKELTLLQEHGAVGHIAGHFYDINGKEIVTSLLKRMIAIDYASIKKVEDVICVAGLEEKVEAIVGALRAGMLNTLITDADAALKILQYDRGE